MSLSWLLGSWRHRSRGIRVSRAARMVTNLRLEMLEKRELLDAASGMRPVVRHPGAVPAFDESNFVSGLYFDLLHRQPQQAEVDSWTSALTAGVSPAQVVLTFLTSAEYRTSLIRGDYQTFLGRDADAGGLQAMLQALSQGATPQDLMAGFVSSAEYFQKQGGTIPGWVNGVYQDLLGRPADAAGLALWTQRVQSGVPRDTVAHAFVYSQEENVRLVSAAYQTLLARAADNGGLQYWAAALAKGLPLAQLETLLATSTEYLNLQAQTDYAGGGGIASGNPVSRFDTKDPSSGTLTVGPNVDVNRETGDQTEETVAVDPNNPSRVFIAANEDNLAAGGMAAYSTNGGATWTPYVIGTGRFGDGLPFFSSDPWAAWDEFGNLFFTYISETSPGSGLFNLVVLLSTNGGQSFSALSSGIAINDHPEVAAGSGVVAVTFNIGSPRTLTGQIGVLTAAVTGLGQVGPFFLQTVPNSDGKNFGDVAIGPAGQVVVTYQSDTSGPGPDTAVVSLDPNQLGASKFSSPRVAANIKVGGFRPVPPQPVRTVPANLELAYDRSNGPHRGRLYLSYADAVNTTTNNLNIFVQFSDDDGKTWSEPVKVNDDTGRAVHFFPAIAVDQSTGNLAVAWYDTRNDPGRNANVQVFASVSTDGGQTFLPNVQVSSGSSNAIRNNDTFGNDFGDYLGLDYSHGVFYPAWADNSSTLPGNPNRPNFDIATAKVIGPSAPSTPTGGGTTGGGTTGGGTTGGGTTSGGTTPFVPRTPDRFDPNETSDEAFSFGILSGTQTTSNLLISRLPNGLVDNNWWRWQAGRSGTFTVQINYQPFSGGDLNLRVFTLDSQNHLIELGTSRATGVTSQRVSVSVTAGEPLFVWVYGFNHAEANYQMTVTLG